MDRLKKLYTEYKALFFEAIKADADGDSELYKQIYAKAQLLKSNNSDVDFSKFIKMDPDAAVVDGANSYYIEANGNRSSSLKNKMFYYVNNQLYEFIIHDNELIIWADNCKNACGEELGFVFTIDNGIVDWDRNVLDAEFAKLLTLEVKLSANQLVENYYKK
jgi:hypothetical protein